MTCGYSRRSRSGTLRRPRLRSQKRSGIGHLAAILTRGNDSAGSNIPSPGPWVGKVPEESSRAAKPLPGLCLSRPGARACRPRLRGSPRYAPVPLGLPQRQPPDQRPLPGRPGDPSRSARRRGHRDQGRPLVAVDERVVADQRVHERRSLGVDVGKGIPPHDGLLRAKDRRLEKAEVAKVRAPYMLASLSRATRHWARALWRKASTASG